MRANALACRSGPCSMHASGAYHPMHTSLTVITHAGDGTVTATIRVFVDDLSTALGPDVAKASVPLDARTAARVATYVAERFMIVGGDKRRIPLRWCGAKRTGDLFWLCFSAPTVGTLRAATVTNRILLERFPDQVNIVQVQYAGRRESMLFSRAEAPKRLP